MPEFSGFQLPNVDHLTSGQAPRRSKYDEPDYIPSATPADKDIYRQLVFNSGTWWLCGMIGGGIYGAVEGIRNAPSRSFRVLSNSFLNGASKRSSPLANRLALISVFHCTAMWLCNEQLSLEWRTGSEYPSPIVAGALTGAAFNYTKSAATIALGGAVGSALSVGYVFATPYVYSKFISWTRGAKKQRY